jgi:RNA polymerase sigma-70 factor (ECF subfamily)
LTDDRDLWKKMLQGDATAFDVFYREHCPRLQIFLRQIVGSHEAAEDVAQETFKQLWNRPNGFDPDRGTLRSYLYGVGRKQAAEWWRKQRPTEEMSGDRAGCCTTESDSAVNDAFQRLPEEQRALLWLREVQGQSYSELAATFEIPVGTVRSRLFAAREALRDIWYRER